jgi:uncharacterized protein YbcI
VKNSNTGIAREIARVACEFEQRKTGNPPKSITVVLVENTLVITLHGSLSPAELALAKSPAGAAQVQEFHRQLFENSAGSLRREIKRITGVDVREAAVEVAPASGSVEKVFVTGTVVEVFLLAENLAGDIWSGTEIEAIRQSKADRE